MLERKKNVELVLGIKPCGLGCRIQDVSTIPTGCCHMTLLYWLILPFAGRNRVKERLNKEQVGNSEPYLVTNMPVYLIDSEQIGSSEQLCDDQKVP